MTIVNIGEVDRYDSRRQSIRNHVRHQLPMNLQSLPKDKLLSHTAEIVSTQDQTISTLRSEVRVLQVIAAVLLALGVLF